MTRQFVYGYILGVAWGIICALLAICRCARERASRLLDEEYEREFGLRVPGELTGVHGSACSCPFCESWRV